MRVASIVPHRFEDLWCEGILATPKFFDDLFQAVERGIGSSLLPVDLDGPSEVIAALLQLP
jgi:hypothetical protein